MCRRAGSSSSIDGVCAVVNFAVTVLETQLCSAIKQVLKQGFPSGYLDLTQAYTVVMQGRLQQSDSEQTKLTFLVCKVSSAAVITERRRKSAITYLVFGD